MYNLIGTFRQTLPSQTLKVVTPYLKQYGITRIAHITDLDCLGIPTYVAYRPNSRSLSCSQGKGVTHDLAKVSAIMEAIEFYHAEHLPSAELTGTYHQLVHDFNLYPLKRLTKTVYKQDLLDTPLQWLRGTDLVTNNPVYFPKELIDLNRSLSKLSMLALWPSSNGLASGNTYDEALCHAIFELVERDVFETSSTRVVDINQLPDPKTQAIIEAIQQHAHLIVKDLTHDKLRIPIYQALIYDKPSANRLAIANNGHGCHFSAQVALLRAVTEAAQARLTYVSGGRDDLPLHLFDRQPLAQSLNPVQPNCQLEEINTFPDSMSGMLKQLIERLTHHGHNQIIAYRMTPEDYPFAVVRVLIPTLHMDEAGHFVKTREVI